MTATRIECPKCFSEMRRIERSGVVIDRCTGCGGVFLDRGELEQLVQAENAYFGRRDTDDDYDDDDDRRESRDYGKKRKSRRGFLEDLFDFG